MMIISDLVTTQEVQAVHLENSCSYTDGALRQDNNISINGARIPRF